jgi:hypothetical protein
MRAHALTALPAALLATLGRAHYYRPAVGVLLETVCACGWSELCSYWLARNRRFTCALPALYLPLIGYTALAEQRRQRPFFTLCSRSASALLPSVRYERN